ncbi:MAG: PP2C family protein-serine/threonine phosphatase, partial [Pseudanabaena sp. ELA607]
SILCFIRTRCISSLNWRYFTIWYGIYCRSSQTLTYANGGHPPSILITPESIHELSSTGLPVGFFADSLYQQKSLLVPQNSILYILSDGIFEFNLANETLWGMQGFTDLVTKDYQDKKIKSLDELLAEINYLNVSNSFADDLSMIAISFQDES